MIEHAWYEWKNVIPACEIIMSNIWFILIYFDES